jgi:hypothetical protein
MLSFEDEQALALRKAINEIDFPEENRKTLMDRFRDVGDDESLNKLHEEWKKFWKKRSLQLHPDKGGNEDDFKNFREKKEIIDGFFDKYTINEEKAGVQKRKFIDDSHKASFSSIINFLSNNQSQNPNGQSQSSFQGEGTRASRAQARHSQQSNQSGNFRYSPYQSQSRNFSTEGQIPRSWSQTSREQSSRDGLSELDKIFRYIERISAQNSSSKFSAQSGLNFKKNTNHAYSSKNTYSNKNQVNKNFPNENYGSSTQQDEKYHPQNHGNRSRSASNNFYDSTFVFCFTAQGVGIIFMVQQNQRIYGKENHNHNDGPSTFASRFGNNNNATKGFFR